MVTTMTWQTWEVIIKKGKELFYYDSLTSNIAKRRSKRRTHAKNVSQSRYVVRSWCTCSAWSPHTTILGLESPYRSKIPTKTEIQEEQNISLPTVWTQSCSSASVKQYTYNINRSIEYRDLRISFLKNAFFDSSHVHFSFKSFKWHLSPSKQWEKEVATSHLVWQISSLWSFGDIGIIFSS